MSEPRKLHTDGAAGGAYQAAGAGMSDQDQYEAARRRARQLATQNAQRRSLQQPVRSAQAGRKIRQVDSSVLSGDVLANGGAVRLADTEFRTCKGKSGFGIGFERFVMYLTSISNIRDVLPFPRTVGTADI